MKRKILMMTVIGFSSLLFAKTPQVMEYERILKQGGSNTPAATSSSKPVSFDDNSLKMSNIEIPPSVMTGDISVNGEPNLIGTIEIGDNKFAYFVTKDNKIMKLPEGSEVNGKTIDKISSYGINYRNKKGQSVFTPLLNNLVNEKDITFESRAQNNNPAMPN